MFTSVLSKTYRPKQALIDLILCMSMLYWTFVFYNYFAALKGARISKNTSKDVFPERKES